MGVVDLLGPEEYEIYRKVTEMIIHENYQIFGDQDYTFHDIGLIRFESPLEFCDRVQPVTLPKPPYRTYIGRIVTGMGWGMTAAGQTSTDLLHSNSRGISNHKCQRKYLRSKRIQYDITEGMLCVTPTGDAPRGGVCLGDSGGPLVVRNTSIIVGIASWAEVHDNCTKPFPDVFARVTTYIDWIKSKVGPDEEWHVYGTNITNPCPLTPILEEEEFETEAPADTLFNETREEIINEVTSVNYMTTQITTS